jgi:hypothetical protein
MALHGENAKRCMLAPPWITQRMRANWDLATGYGAGKVDDKCTESFAF